MVQAKTITLKDGGLDKQFHIKKLTAMRFMFFTNQLLGMLATTDQLNPQLIRQFINNKLENGARVDGLDADRVQSAVDKEIRDNLFGLIIDLVKSMLVNIDQQQYTLLNSILACISYQNGTVETPLSMNDGDPGFVDVIISDGLTLYKLCLEVLKYNYGGFLSPDPKP